MSIITSFVHGLFVESPILAVFISMAIGFAIGKIRIGKFQLGGVAGSLIAGVCISLFGVTIDSSLKNILFALFIFAVGFTSGPKFFRSLGKRTIREVILAIIVALTGLATVLAVAAFFHLNKGLAAGVASGGLTQSAIMGVSTDALNKLGLSSHLLNLYTTDVGVGYAVTYVFGSLGAILVCANILPLFMRKDIREAAIEVEEEVAQSQEIPEEKNETNKAVSSSNNKTDLILMGIGISVGLLIGMLVLKVGGIPLTLGSGGGALLSGLFFGWLKDRNPALGGEISSPVCTFLTDFGLAGFVAAVGLNSGLVAIQTIEQKGISIFVAGLIVTFVPLLIAMVLGRYMLGYKNAAIFGGALSGARSANPAFGQVLDLAGNSVPTNPFAVTYALANVFLTLLGPIIVALVH